MELAWTQEHGGGDDPLALGNPRDGGRRGPRALLGPALHARGALGVTRHNFKGSLYHRDVNVWRVVCACVHV